MSPIAPPDTHHLQAAEGWFELGNYLEAHAELEQLTSAVRAHPAALKIRWQIYVAARRWEATLDIATALTKLAPEDVISWINLSFSLHELNRTVEARDNILRILHRFPNDATLRYNLACYECQLGNVEKARALLGEAFELPGGMELRAGSLEDPDLQPLWLEIHNI